MLILAFDTTSAACSVTLWSDGAVLQAARSVMDYGQAEALMPMIEEIMAAANISYLTLDRIAVTIGPGSFTGVRVGLAVARGIAMAAEKPVIGLTSMEVLAHAVADTDVADAAGIIVAIDTKRGDFFVQKFDAAREAFGDIATMPPEAVKAWAGEGSWVVVGDGAATIATATNGRASAASAFPDAGVLARLAAARTPPVGGPLPLYINPPAVTMPSLTAPT